MFKLRLRQTLQRRPKAWTNTGPKAGILLGIPLWQAGINPRLGCRERHLASQMSWEDAVRWSLAQPDMQKLAADAYFGDPVDAAERYRASAEYAAVRKLLPATPGRALDLGAGNGILSGPNQLVGAGPYESTGISFAL